MLLCERRVLRLAEPFFGAGGLSAWRALCERGFYPGGLFLEWAKSLLPGGGFFGRRARLGRNLAPHTSCVLWAESLLPGGGFFAKSFSCFAGSWDRTVRVSRNPQASVGVETIGELGVFDAVKSPSIRERTRCVRIWTSLEQTNPLTFDWTADPWGIGDTRRDVSNQRAAGDRASRHSHAGVMSELKVPKGVLGIIACRRDPNDGMSGR